MVNAGIEVKVEDYDGMRELRVVLLEYILVVSTTVHP